LAPIVGHAGDGNFHVLVLFDDKTPEGIAVVEDFVARLNERALAMDGTCTGEHGIGQGKMAFLEQELGDAGYLMRQIKEALDPDAIFTPGKVVRGHGTMEAFHVRGLLRARMALGCSRSFPVFVLRSHMDALVGWHTS